jgi:sensor histidine kinase YesM
MGTTVYFISSWFEAQLAREKLAREKAEMELKSLKDQIHPHFLFNTLNNIYSLALLQSDKTAEMMLRLSKLLSFMVYDGNATTGLCGIRKTQVGRTAGNFFSGYR